MPSLLAVIIAAVINMVIGMVWYSPVLFAKQWMKLNNIDSGKMKSMGKDKMRMYAVPTATALVTAFVLGWFIKTLGATDAASGAMLGFVTWLGFTTTTQLTNWIFSGKKLGAYLVDTGYQLTTFVVMGALLGWWK